MHSIKQSMAAWATLATAAVPLLWVTGVLSFALRAKLELGHWPAPYYPDPKTLHMDGHYVAVFLLAYLVVASLSVLPTLRLCTLNLVPQRIWRKSKMVYLVGWGLIFTFLLIPKINFVAWFLD